MTGTQRCIAEVKRRRENGEKGRRGRGDGEGGQKEGRTVDKREGRREEGRRQGGGEKGDERRRGEDKGGREGGRKGYEPPSQSQVVPFYNLDMVRGAVRCRIL